MTEKDAVKCKTPRPAKPGFCRRGRGFPGPYRPHSGENPWTPGFLTSLSALCKSNLEHRKAQRELVCKPCKLAFPIGTTFPSCSKTRPASSNPTKKHREFQGRHSGPLRLDPAAGQNPCSTSGKPMVVRVAERARLSGADEIWVAMTTPSRAGCRRGPRHQGHDDQKRPPDGHRPPGRSRGALGWGGDTIIVNVQGDEPCVEPQLIARTARQLAASGRISPPSPIPSLMPPISSIPTWSRWCAGPTATLPIFPGARPFMPATTSPGRAAENPAGRFAGLPSRRPLRLPGDFPPGLRRPGPGAHGTVRGPGTAARPLARLPHQRNVVDGRRPGVDTPGRCRTDAQTV